MFSKQVAQGLNYCSLKDEPSINAILCVLLLSGVNKGRPWGRPCKVEFRVGNLEPGNLESGGGKEGGGRGGRSGV